jgi:hypothetical protein
MNQFFLKMKSTLSTIISSIFEAYAATGLQKRILISFSLALYFFGLWKWSLFCRFGNMDFSSADWYKELAFYSVLRQALIDGAVPYHINGIFHGTNRFIALPELIFSPQIVFLKYTSNIGQFVLFHVLFLFTMGFVGCIAIQRKFKLSVFSFLTLTSIFSFSGYITAHLAVGHTMWGGYFLLPWFFFAILRTTDDTRPVRANALWISMVLLLIWLQGSLHILVGCLIYLVLFALFNVKYFRVVILSFFFAFILCFFRIFPALVSFTEHELYFQSGYPTIRDLFDAFTVIKVPSIDMIGGLTGALYWWELDLFIGIIALGFLIVFGIYMARYQDDMAYQFTEFTYPNLITALFAISHFFAPVANLPIPLASVERVPSRMMIIPVLMIVIISCVRFDYYMKRFRSLTVVHWLAIFALIQTFFELMTHMRYWNVPAINATLPTAPVLKILAVEAAGDQFFVNSVRVSFLVSAVGLLAWCVLVLWPDRRSPTQ